MNFAQKLVWIFTAMWITSFFASFVVDVAWGWPFSFLIGWIISLGTAARKGVK